MQKQADADLSTFWFIDPAQKPEVSFQTDARFLLVTVIKKYSSAAVTVNIQTDFGTIPSNINAKNLEIFIV